MEYAGATSTDPIAYEHEVFHMWWGRGIEPATYADGWVDEAWDTYCTGAGSHATIPFDWKAPPVALYDAHPFARETPSDAYAKGRLLFAGLADLLGHDALMAAMRSLHAAEPLPRSFTTAELERHLCCSAGELPEVRQAFHRFVHGREGVADPPAPDYCAD
jgi:hypothetical protein